MKNIYDVLREKEFDLLVLRRDVAALRLVIPLLAEANDPALISSKAAGQIVTPREA